MSEDIPALLSKKYAPAVKSRLSRFPSQDQNSLAAWLIQNPIGTNYALQILEQLADLAKKEEVGAARLLTRVLAALPKDDKFHPKNFAQRLREFLREKLNPQSSEHQRKFQHFTRGLNLPAQVSLRPPQNFEGKVYALEVKFSDSAELKGHLQEVLKSLDKDPWDALKKF